MDRERPFTNVHAPPRLTLLNSLIAQGDTGLSPHLLSNGIDLALSLAQYERQAREQNPSNYPSSEQAGFIKSFQIEGRHLIDSSAEIIALKKTGANRARILESRKKFEAAEQAYLGAVEQAFKMELRDLSRADSLSKTPSHESR